MYLLLTLTGCKLFYPQQHGRYFQITEFKTLTDRFSTEANLHGVVVGVFDIFIQFGVLEKQYVIGTCYKGGGIVPTIVIEEDYWDNSTDLIREQLLFHELGHCVLDLDHNNTLNNGVPISLMHESVINEYWYKLYHDDYLNELFVH